MSDVTIVYVVLCYRLDVVEILRHDLFISEIIISYEHLDHIYLIEDLRLDPPIPRRSIGTEVTITYFVFLLILCGV